MVKLFNLFAAKDTSFLNKESFLQAAVNMTSTVCKHHHHLAHHHGVFEIVHHMTHFGVKAVSALGTLILLAGVLIAAFNIAVSRINAGFGTKVALIKTGFHFKHSIASFYFIRKQLGEITALGLEVLVVADVLETLTKEAGSYSWDDLGKLIVISLVRTLLAFMLGRELNEIDEKMHVHPE